MKITFKGIVAVVIITVFFYTACKKAHNTPVVRKIATEQQVAGVIASDIAASLAAKFGGVSLKDGIKPPSVLALKNNRKVVNSISPLCGFTVDTSVTYNSISGGSSFTVSGKFVFTFTCSLASPFPDGYIVSTNFTSRGTTPYYSFIDTIAQHYVVQSLVPQDTLVSLDGTLISFDSFKYNKSAFVDTTFVPNPVFQNQNYVLTGLKVDVPASLDVISGTATFITNGNNSFGSWLYTGTILFLGNHKALITINGIPYNANLLTGTVTPA
jgi:hypothetical protein